MKYCHQCEAPNHEQSMFCRQCGTVLKMKEPPPPIPALKRPVVTAVDNAPTKEETTGDEQSGGSKMLTPEQLLNPKQRALVDMPREKVKIGRVVALVLCGALLIGAIGAGVYYRQEILHYFAPAGANQASLSDDDVAALKKRIEAAQTEFANGTLEYDAYIAELNEIEKMSPEELASGISVLKDHAQNLKDSRTAFATAEEFLAEGDHLQAMKWYKQVDPKDSVYETARQKSEACTKAYRTQILKEAEAFAQAGDQDAVIAVLKAALENLPGDQELKGRLEEWGQCTHVYEDGHCKNCGTEDATYEGLAQDINGDWYYAREGEIDTTFTGMCERNGISYYVRDGKLDWNFTGLVDDDETWYYVEKGRWVTTFAGLVTYNEAMFVIKEGVVDRSFSGLYTQDGIQYYIRGGEYRADFTGICRHDGAWYYVSEGKLDQSYNGSYQQDGITYTIVDGVVQ